MNILKEFAKLFVKSKLEDEKQKLKDKLQKQIEKQHRQTQEYHNCNDKK